MLNGGSFGRWLSKDEKPEKEEHFKSTFKLAIKGRGTFGETLERI